MIWLAWRQYRVQAAVGLGILIVFAVIFSVTGPHIWHIYDSIVKPCAKHNDCSTVTNTFLNHYNFYEHLIQVSVIFPALIGAFWGAPLVAREFETGTFRLAWAQSETRARWLGAKLAIVGLGSVIFMGLFTLMATWWSSIFDRINDTPYGTFDVRDIVPVGYAAFGFALGVALGVVIRRTVPAMAATLAGYAAVLVIYNQRVRPHLLSPLHFTSPWTGPFTNAGLSGPPNQADLVISQTIKNKSGRVIGQNGGIGPNGQINFGLTVHGRPTLIGVGRCPNVFPTLKHLPGHGHIVVSGPNPALVSAMDKCIASFHLTDVLTYQPVDRYWTFQWLELASYLVFTALLGAFSFWWVRRR
jgi:hypothetical protein